MGKNNKKVNGRITDTTILNNMTFQYYYNWLKLIALNIVYWENVPDTIDLRYLELCLFEKGQAVFFKDDIMGHLALPVNLSGNFDVYGIPKNYYAYSSATGYQNRDLNKTNSVLIFNNYLRTNSELVTQIYANKLYNIDRSIDVNVSAQRTPVMVGCSEQQKLTMRNLIADYDGNEPFIYLDNKIDLSGVKVFNTQAPYVADKLESLKHNILNDFLSNFGIENANADKKERMVTDEVNANYGLVEISRNIFLTPRNEAAAKYNKMYGTDIKVSFNSDLKTLINGFMRDTVNGGDNIE